MFWSLLTILPGLSQSETEVLSLNYYHIWCFQWIRKHVLSPHFTNTKSLGIVHKTLLILSLRTQSPASLSFSARSWQRLSHSRLESWWNLRKESCVPGTKTDFYLPPSACEIINIFFSKVQTGERTVKFFVSKSGYWGEESKWTWTYSSLDLVSSLLNLSFCECAASNMVRGVLLRVPIIPFHELWSNTNFSSNILTVCISAISFQLSVPHVFLKIGENFSLVSPALLKHS